MVLTVPRWDSTCCQGFSGYHRSTRSPKQCTFMVLCVPQGALQGQGRQTQNIHDTSNNANRLRLTPRWCYETPYFRLFLSPTFFFFFWSRVQFTPWRLGMKMPLLLEKSDTLPPQVWPPALTPAGEAEKISVFRSSVVPRPTGTQP
jgi:hypothetical protein